METSCDCKLPVIFGIPEGRERVRSTAKQVDRMGTGKVT
jgi:hypothetical protein